MCLPSRVRSIPRFMVAGMVFGAFTIFPLALYAQASPSAPTFSEDPSAIDQTWQKASEKYDAPRAAILNEVDRVARQGPFRPDWESLQKYEVPDWYKNAKFGVFIHWGVYSVPAFGDEWYPRNMYREGEAAFRHHAETWGPPSRFGYKDFIPL